MIPQSFDYYQAHSLSEALKYYQKYGDNAKYISGGHSLLPMMKLRFATPSQLIDISKMEGFSFIKEEDNFLKIGALTTQSEIEHAPLIKKKYPIFTDAAKLIADPSVRNLGTLGGNLAHGDAANDQPALMMAMRATIVAEGIEGQKSIPIDSFFQGFYETALDPGSILTEIHLPKAKVGASGAYHKVERKVGDYATAGVAVYIHLDSAQNCEQIGIALTNVDFVPARVERAEQILLGNSITETLIEKAAVIASEDCSPSSDLRGTEEYKRAVVKAITKQTLIRAIMRAKLTLKTN